MIADAAHAPRLCHLDSPVQSCTMRVIEMVQSEYRAGRRTFHIAIPVPAWKRHIGAALIRLFRQKTLLFTEYPLGLIPWREDADNPHGDLQEAAGDVWSGQTAHVLSMLPFSCAPITALAFHADDPALSLDDAQGQRNAERLHRHFLKHGYRLLLLDECREEHADWRPFLDAYARAADAVTIHLAALAPAGDSRGPLHDGGAALTCLLPTAAFVRGGYLFPYRVFADVAAAPARERLLAILADEHDVLQDHLCALVLVDAPGGRRGRSTGGFTRCTALLNEIVAAPRCDNIHPLLVTDSSVICHDEMVIPILSEVQKLINARLLDVRLSSTPLGDCSELVGEGNDWDAGVHRLLVTELCARGLTRCLLGSPSLFAAGWETLPVNTIIDASTTVQASPFVQQLPPQTIADGMPWHTVHFWTLAAAQPGDPSGLDGWKRVSAQLAAIPGVADDGTIEYGTGQSHPLLAHDANPAVHAAAVRADYRAALHARNRLAQSWKVGQTSGGRRLHGLECRCEGAGPESGYPEQMQRAALQEDWSIFREKRRLSRLRRVLWGMGACGAALSALLLFDVRTALPGAVLTVVAYLTYAVSAWLRVRRAAPARLQLDAMQLLSLGASVVSEALGRLQPEVERAQRAAMHLRQRSDGWSRLVPGPDSPDGGAGFADACTQFLQPWSAAYALQTCALDIGTKPFLARGQQEPDTGTVHPSIRFGVPQVFASDARSLAVFLDVVHEYMGACNVARNARNTASPDAQDGADPGFAVQQCMVWE